MKKFILLSAVCLISVNIAWAQGGLLKKVTKSMANELIGKPKESAGSKPSNQPEPPCACDQAEQVLDLGGKIQLAYTELSISMRDDGALLLRDRLSGNYYIAAGGVTQGPIPEGDPRISGFDAGDKSDEKNKDYFTKKYKEYITRSGDKYTITFGGKSYGPYSLIKGFAVTKAKDKFAAIVIENMVVTEDQGNKMDEAMKKAKTDQEKMELAMQFSQQMTQKMMQGGGPSSMTDKLVTNISGANVDPMKTGGGTLNGNVKYDDIMVTSYDKIYDIQSNVLFSLKPEVIGSENLFVNTTNTKYAAYRYGTLYFSDNTTLSELFNPHLVKADGKVYLAYMYYSPKRNSLMRCKIAF